MMGGMWTNNNLINSHRFHDLGDTNSGIFAIKEFWECFCKTLLLGASVQNHSVSK